VPTPPLLSAGDAGRGASSRTRGKALGLAGVWLVSALYLGYFALRGWIPHDEGLLAHSAERVLAGEVPHRDFDEAYTGGLTYLHAAAFALLGVKLTSLRIVLLGFALAWVPVIYSIAARFVSPLGAAMVTALCVAWSLPNYFAALPSWYVIFFTTFGIQAFLRHVDSGRDRWLFVAGLCGGAAFLVKSVALYYVAAGMLFLLHREQCQAKDSPLERAARIPWMLFVNGAAVAVVLAVLLALLRPRLGAMEAIHFLLPAAAVCAVSCATAWRARRRGESGIRLRRLIILQSRFLAGVVAPIGVFLVPYLLDGDLGAFWRGVFIVPQRRLQVAVFPLPPSWTLVAALPQAALLASRGLSRRTERLAIWALTILFTAALAGAVLRPVYRAIWNSLRPLVPIAVVLGCSMLLGVPRDDELSRSRRAELFLLLAMVAFMNLLQYPYAYGIYFFYVAPVLILSIAAIVSSRTGAPVSLHVRAFWFYLAFALGMLNWENVWSVGLMPAMAEPMRLLALERAGLRVPREDAELYTRLVAEIRKHSEPGAYIYAAPDCPQVYFLSERLNPTRTMYDMFDPDFARPEARRERILGTLEARRVAVVVLNTLPDFTRGGDPLLIRELLRRYPNELRLPPFVVRWRA
jgi:hypothetical protein